MAVNRVNLYQQDTNKIRKVIEPLNMREAIWLRNFFEDELGDGFKEISDTNVKNELIDELIANDDARKILDESLLTMRASILPNSNFEWLKNDLRAQIYTLETLINDRGFHSRREVYGFDSLMEEVYSYIDNLKYVSDKSSNKRLVLDEKADLLKRVKSYWDVINEAYNYSDWLKPDADEQIKWSNQYLIDRRIYNLARIDNSDLKQVRESILASIDLIDDYVDFSIQHNIRYTYRSYRTSSSKLLFIDKMKRAWSQKKFRDAGKTKKPHHLPLTKSTREKLEKLSEVKGLSSTAMLDILINNAYKQECLDIDGNELY